MEIYVFIYSSTHPVTNSDLSLNCCSHHCWFRFYSSGIDSLERKLIHLKNIDTNICFFSFLRPKIYIEQKALDTIAYLCDGDARTGLNSLQLAVQAQVSSTRQNLLAQDGSPQEILVKEEHVKEGLQRSHILYDRAGKPKCTNCFNVTVVLAERCRATSEHPKSIKASTAVTSIQFFSVNIALFMIAKNMRPCHRNINTLQHILQIHIFKNPLSSFIITPVINIFTLDNF